MDERDPLCVEVRKNREFKPQSRFYKPTPLKKQADNTLTKMNDTIKKKSLE